MEPFRIPAGRSNGKQTGIFTSKHFLHILCLPWRPRSTQLGFNVNNRTVARPGQGKPFIKLAFRATTTTFLSTLGKVALLWGCEDTGFLTRLLQRGVEIRHQLSIDVIWRCVFPKVPHLWVIPSHIKKKKKKEIKDEALARGFRLLHTYFSKYLVCEETYKQ